MSFQRRRWSRYSIAACLGCIAVSAFTLGVRAQQAAAPLEVPPSYAAQPAPEQPLPYSHRTHLELGLACEMCHAGGQVRREHMGFPETARCMACHASIAADRPSIQRLAEYEAANEDVPWVRVYEVLPGVTWSHAPHLAANVECDACHGDVAQSDTLSMTTSVTAMASCIGCHESRSADTACTTCHAWPAE